MADLPTLSPGDRDPANFNTKIRQSIQRIMEVQATAESALQSPVVNADLADMAQATFKLRAAAAGTGPPIDGTAAQALAILASLIGATKGSFSVHKNGSDQTGVVDATDTQIAFGTEIYDVGGFFASNLWTPPAGKIHLDGSMLVSGTIAVGALVDIAIYKNGAAFKRAANYTALANNGVVRISIDDDANGSDTYGLYAFIDVTAGTGTILGLATYTYFMGHCI